MSSNSFVSTLELRPGASHRALSLLLGLHLIPAVLVVIAMPAGWPMLVVAALLALSWLWLRRHAAFGYGPAALTRLIWHADGDWTLEDAAGNRHQAQLQGSSVLHPAVLILNFRLPQRRRGLTRVLLGDELPPENLRRLRARLAVQRAGS